MKILSLIILALLTGAFLGCKKEGVEGKKSLLDMVTEPKGDNCSTGGIKVISGIDINRNEVLDASEIQNTKYICNGNNGINGNNSLLNVIPETAGANCLSGGYKIVSGIDTNNNSILDANEIQNTEYICNGTDGINGNNMLMNVIPEAAGTNCSSGGHKIISGIDLNKNNILDSNEIQNVQYICNGDDGGYDKQTRIYFPNNGYSYGTSSVNGSIVNMECLFDFDISNYLKADSIVFGSYLSTSDAEVSCIVELYDITNSKVIANTSLTSRSTEWEWQTTSVNFIGDLPVGAITLGLRMKSQNEGIYVNYFLPMITIYRK